MGVSRHGYRQNCSLTGLSRYLHSSLAGQAMDGKTKVQRKRPAIGKRGNPIKLRDATSDKEEATAGEERGFKDGRRGVCVNYLPSRSQLLCERPRSSNSISGARINRGCDPAEINSRTEGPTLIAH